MSKTKKELLIELELEKENNKILQLQIEQQAKNCTKLLKEQEDKYDQLCNEGQAWYDLAQEYAKVIYKLKQKYNDDTMEEFLRFFIQSTNISTPFDKEFEKLETIRFEERKLDGLYL